MTPDSIMRYTAPNGTQFKCIVLTGRVDIIYGTVAVRRDDNGRLVHAEPKYLEPLPN